MGEETQAEISHGGDRVNLIYQVEDLPSGQGGTSRDYTIARLKRDNPDIAKLVIDGAITAAEGHKPGSGFSSRITSGFSIKNTATFRRTLIRIYGTAPHETPEFRWIKVRGEDKGKVREG